MVLLGKTRICMNIAEESTQRKKVLHLTHN